MHASTGRGAVGRCPVCRSNTANSPHHIVPHAEGGNNSKKNVVFLCRRCHDIVEEIYDKTRVTYSPRLVSIIRKQQDFPLGFSEDKTEHRREYRRKYYRSHREKCLEAVRAWNKTNKGKEWRRMYSRNYQEEHKEELREYSRRRYREKHPKRANEPEYRRLVAYKALLAKPTLTADLQVSPRPAQNRGEQRFFSNLRERVRQLQCVSAQKN